MSSSVNTSTATSPLERFIAPHIAEALPLQERDVWRARWIAQNFLQALGYDRLHIAAAQFDPAKAQMKLEIESPQDIRTDELTQMTQLIALASNISTHTALTVIQFGAETKSVREAWCEMPPLPVRLPQYLTDQSSFAGREVDLEAVRDTLWQILVQAQVPEDSRPEKDLGSRARASRNEVERTLERFNLGNARVQFSDDCLIISASLDLGELSKPWVLRMLEALTEVQAKHNFPRIRFEPVIDDSEIYRVVNEELRTLSHWKLVLPERRAEIIVQFIGEPVSQTRLDHPGASLDLAECARRIRLRTGLEVTIATAAELGQSAQADALRTIEPLPGWEKISWNEAKYERQELARNIPPEILVQGLRVHGNRIVAEIGLKNPPDWLLDELQAQILKCRLPVSLVSVPLAKPVSSDSIAQALESLAIRYGFSRAEVTSDNETVTLSHHVDRVSMRSDSYGRFLELVTCLQESAPHVAIHIKEVCDLEDVFDSVNRVLGTTEPWSLGFDQESNQVRMCVATLSNIDDSKLADMVYQAWGLSLIVYQGDPIGGHNGLIEAQGSSTDFTSVGHRDLASALTRLLSSVAPEAQISWRYGNFLQIALPPGTSTESLLSHLRTAPALPVHVVITATGEADSQEALSNDAIDSIIKRQLAEYGSIHRLSQNPDGFQVRLHAGAGEINALERRIEEVRRISGASIEVSSAALSRRFLKLKGKSSPKFWEFLNRVADENGLVTEVPDIKRMYEQSYFDLARSARNGKTDPRGTRDRKNLTNLDTFSFDPANAVILESTFSCNFLGPDILRVGLHLVDTAALFPLWSAEDLIAQQRGLSLYGGNGQIVMPLVHPRIAIERASLAIGTPRPCISVTMDFDSEAKLIGWKLESSVVANKARLDDDQVSQVVQFERSHKHQRAIRAMYKLSKLMRSERIGSRNGNGSLVSEGQLINSEMTTMANYLLRQHLMERGVSCVARTQSFLPQELGQELMQEAVRRPDMKQFQGTLYRPSLQQDLVDALVSRGRFNARILELLGQSVGGVNFSVLDPSSRGARDMAARFSAPLRKGDALANMQQISRLLSGMTPLEPAQLDARCRYINEGLLAYPQTAHELGEIGHLWSIMRSFGKVMPARVAFHSSDGGNVWIDELQCSALMVSDPLQMTSHGPRGDDRGLHQMSENHLKSGSVKIVGYDVVKALPLVTLVDGR